MTFSIRADSRHSRSSQCLRASGSLTVAARIRFVSSFILLPSSFIPPKLPPRNPATRCATKGTGSEAESDNNCSQVGVGVGCQSCLNTRRSASLPTGAHARWRQVAPAIRRGRSATRRVRDGYDEQDKSHPVNPVNPVSNQRHKARNRCGKLPDSPTQTMPHFALRAKSFATSARTPNVANSIWPRRARAAAVNITAIARMNYADSTAPLENDAPKDIYTK